MKTLVQLGRCLLFVSLLWPFAYSADDKPEVGMSGGMVVVPDGMKPADVQQCILLAGTGRGWTVKERSDGKVVLFLEQSGWRSTMTLTYDTKEIQIISNSGKVDKRSGMISKQEIPSWLRYLKQDITKNLGMKAFAK